MITPTRKPSRSYRLLDRLCARSRWPPPGKTHTGMAQDAGTGTRFPAAALGDDLGHQPASPPTTATTTFSAQTLRQIVHTSLGGSLVRVRLCQHVRHQPRWSSTPPTSP